MKKMNKMRFLAKTIISSFVLLAIFTACEVGLGSNVDTAAPKIEILSPEPSSTHKGEFQITGTASDEIAVRSVSVNLLENGTARYSYKANYDAASGKWSVSIPTLDENNKPIVEDLKYEIQAIATDTDGKTSVATRSVQVDNSAPTVLVTSPSLFNENKSTFFRQLRVSGSAYDASEISSVKVYFYSMEDFQDGTSFDYAYTDKYVVYNAEGTNTWNLTKDLILSESTTESDKNVIDFFENNEEYHFFVVAEDIAGNKNTYFYRMGDFYSKGIISDTTNDGDNYIPFPSMVQIGKFDQGEQVENPTSGLTAEGLEQIKIECDNLELNDSNFLYRSESVPSVSWGNIEFADGVPRAIPRETDITGQIKTSDTTDILPTSIEVLLASGPNEPSEDDWWVLDEKYVTLDPFGTSASFNIVLKKDGETLKSGNYFIKIKYKTVASINNSDSLESNPQPFEISEGLPVLTETKMLNNGTSPVSAEMYTSKESVTLGGKAQKGDGTPVDKIFIKENDKEIPSPTIGANGEWELTRTKEGSYRFEIEIQSGTDKTTISRTVIIDRTSPAIENMSFDQSADRETVTLRAFISDDNSFKEIYYAFVKGITEPSEEDWKVPEEKKNSLNIVIKPSEGKEFEQGPWTMWIKASDPAGNEKIEKYSGILDLESPEFSDNFKSTTIPENGYLNKDFYYVAADLSDDVVLATDNYEISKIEIVAKKDGKVSDTLSATKAINKKELKKSDVKDLPVIESIAKNEGKWIITFTLYDLNSNKVEKTLDFSMDVTKPIVSIEKVPQAKDDNTSPFEFRGTASDNASGVNKIFISLDKEKWTEIEGIKSWGKELPITAEGNGCVFAYAIDGAGNESEIVNKEFTFDESKPEIKVTTNSGNSQWATGTNYTLEGTAEDSWLMSKDSPVTITQTRGTETVTLTGVNYDVVAKTWKVEGLPRNENGETIPEEKITTGNYVYTIKATDIVGKESKTVVTVQIDKDAPTVPEVISPNGNVGINAIAATTYKFQGNTQETGESATGVKQVEYLISEKATSPESGTILPSTGSWNFTDDFTQADEGKKYLHIRSEDNAGNKSDWKTVEFDVDFSSPTVELPTFKDKQNTLFTLSGTAKDTKGLASENSVVIIQRDSEGEELLVATTITDDSWTTITLPVKATNESVTEAEKDAYNDTYTYEIKVTDWCGKTTVVSKTVNFDTKAPEIEIQNLTTGTFLNANKIDVRGSVNDESKIDGVYWALDGNPSVPSDELENWTNYGWAKIETQTSWTISLENMVDGSHTLRIAAVDKQGNACKEEINFSTDITPPTLDDVIDAEPEGTYLEKGCTFSFANIAGATVAKDNYELSRYEIIATKDGAVQTGKNSPINYWYKKELSGTEVTQTELNDIPVLESKESNNGAWKFTIAVYDKAGNKAEATRSFTVDATNPELTSIDVYPKADEDRTSPFTFKGKASDRGLSSLSEVKVSLDKNTWTTAIGTKEWNTELAIPAEGEGVVYAKAIDGAGNESAIVEQTFTFDKSRPSVTVTTKSGNPEWATGTNYTLEGTAEDSWLMSSESPVTITQTRGTETVTLTEVEYDVVAKTWKVEGLPRNADNNTIASGKIETGTYVYTIVAKDKAGKTSEKEVTVKIDKDAPTIPKVISPNGNVGINAIAVKTYRFQGNTEDIGSSATGVKQVEYKISESSSPETSGTTILASSGSWNFTQDFEEGKEGKKYLHIRAEDNAGNKSSWNTVPFDVDFSAPEVKVSENFKGNEKAIFTLSGTASDTKGLASANSVVITQRDSAGKALTVTSTVTGNSWKSQTLPVMDNGKSVEAGNEADYNGTYTYEIKATDWCGKTTTITKTVNFDTVAPELDIKNLVDGEFLAQEEIIIQGTVRDSSKIDAVYYQTTDENAEPDSTKWTPIETQNSWQIPLTELIQGKQVLHLKVVDELGNGDNKVTSVSFTVDTEKPSISVDKEGDKTYYTKDGITVSGTAEDAISLKQVDIKLGATPLKTINASEIGEDKKWSCVIEADSLASDIATNVIISAVDNAGHVANAPVFNVYKDTKKPDLVLKNIDNGTIITEQDLKDGKFTIKGSWNDNGGSGLSGDLSKLEYKLNSGNWTTISTTNSEWSQEITLTEGEGQTISFKATDAVGNEQTLDLKEILIDLSLPTITTSVPEELFTNKEYTLSGTASDALAIDDVKVFATKDGKDTQIIVNTEKADDGKSLTWSFTVKEEGCWKFDIKATDKAERESVVTKLTVNIDKTSPSAPTVYTPAEGTKGLSSITSEKYRFSGTTSDVGNITTGIGAIKYAIQKTDTTPTTLETVTSSENWNFEKELTEGKYYLYVKSVDNAGNESDYTVREFDVDYYNPTLKVDEIEKNQKSLFKLNITEASDTKELKTLEITQTSSDGTSLKLEKSGKCSIDLPLKKTETGVESVTEAEKDAYNDTYTYEIKATDWCGKTTTVSKTVNFDTKAPEIEVKNLKEGDFLTSTTITISGTVNDSSKIKGISYQITGKDEDLSTWKAIENKTSWNIPQTEFEKDLSETEGAKVLHLKVEDELGNNKVTSVSFTVDTQEPSISVDKEGDKTYYTKDGITVSGTAEDAISLKQVDIKLGATPLKTINASEIGEDKKWSCVIEADSLASDIATNVIISAVDNAGHVANAPVFNVYKDTKEPTLVLNNIATGTIITEQDLSNNQFTVKGSWNDNGGSGYAKLEYCLDAEISDLTKWTEVKVNNAVPEATWNFPITLETETLDQIFNIRVTDSVGNSKPKTFTGIIVDKSAPKAGTKTSDNQQIGKDENYTLTGIATDKLGLEKIEIISSNGIDDPTTETHTVSNNATEYSWSKVLETDSLYETWTFTIKAYDVAGRVSEVETRKVLVDKVAPVFTPNTLKITQNKVDKTDWYKSNILTVTGTLTENTGIKAIRFSTDNTTWSSFNIEQSDNEYKFTGNVSVNEDWNKGTIFIEAEDVLGNKATTQLSDIYVDITNPTVEINESIVYVNASTKSLSISVEPSDSGSGVKAVSGDYGSEIKKETNGTYTISLNVGDLKDENIPSTGTITVEVIDNVGKTGYATVQYEKDIVLPTVAITSHSAGDTVNTVNKTITLKGSTTESQGLAKVEIFAVDTSDTLLETFEGNAGFNWSCEIDTEDYDDEAGTGTLLIKVVATDNAGNKGETTLNLAIDQKSDRPEITLTNVTPNGFLTGQKYIWGSLSDDDGNIKSLEVSLNGGSSWTLVPTPNNGFTYYFNPTETDGEKEIYFKVIDNADGEFVTKLDGEETTLDIPVLAKNEKYYSSLKFNLDTNPPEIKDENTKLVFADRNEEIFSSNVKVGGNRKEFTLKVDVNDGSGIKEVSLTVGNKTILGEYKGNDPDKKNGIWEIIVNTSKSDTDDDTDDGIDDGELDFEIKVIDNADFSITRTKTLLVDNQAPAIDIESHTIGEHVLGKTRISGTTTDDIDGISGSGIKSVKWLVAKDTVLSTKTTDDGIIDLFINPTEEEKDNIKTYSVKGTLSWNYSFGDNNDNLGELVTNGYGSDIGNEIYELPIFFLIEDNVGNQKLEKFRLNVDPNGDKPRPSVSYPSDGEKLGGTIRINGTTKIEEGTVEKVYIQLGSLDDETGEFKPFTKDAFDTWFKDNNCSCPYTFEDETVIEATGTAAWNITINENKEFNLESGFTGLVEKDDLSYVSFRVRAKNTEDKLGAWTDPITISLDKKVPEISNPRLVKYDENDKEIASKDYISGDWISGDDWVLVTTVKDENGLISIKLTEVSENAKIVFGEIKNVPANEETEVRIPLETTTFTGNNFSFILSATDNSTEQNNSEKLISLKFDNNGPELEPLEHGGKEIDKETNPIEQDNNGFDISSSITEKNNGSDLDRILLYFKDTHNGYYYVPMVNEDEKIVLSQWTGETLSDGLPGKKIELDKTIEQDKIKGRPDERTIQDDSIGTNKFIKEGGVVRIGNILCRIESVDDSTGEVTIDTDVPTNFTDAEFIYALVIDNINGGEYIDQDGKLENDDGDGFEEKLSLTGSTYDWSVVINSKEIPDGPVTMYCLAYDKAGNCSTIQAQETMVQNNRPAIAKVWLGTDLNGDNNISSNEEVLYREDETIDTADGSVTLMAADFTAKGRTSIRPEIVGGNGNLYYEDISDGYANKILTLLKDVKDDEIAENDGEDDENAENDEAIKLELVEDDNNTTLAGRGDTATDKTETFTFKIWDSTPGLIPGDNSLSATITVFMKIDVVDGNAPTVVIDPLDWKSKTDNSLYQNSTANGHIDLSADLPTEFTSGGSGVMDRDDKVSGKITFTGTAYDDVRLGSLDFTFDEFSDTITFDNSDNQWSSVKKMDSDGYVFTATTDSLDQGGHKVNWTLSIDTAKIEKVAATDVNLTVSATDKGSNPSSTKKDDSEDETKKNVPSYKVDVVPYIAGIVRSDTTKSNTTMNRSTYGEYPIAVGDTIEVTGFNLGTGFKVGNTRVTVTESTATKVYKLSGITNSGELTVTVNEITNLNASNNNSKSYNQDVDNAKWFDNCYLRVWDVDHYFSDSTGGNMPTMIADKKGNLFSSWTLMGSATVQLQRNLKNGTQKPSYAGYDQPDKITAFAVDKSKDNGDLSVLFLPANVGNGGKVTNIGYANGKNVGGAWGQGISNDLSSISTSFGTNKEVTISSNPKHAIDGTTWVAGFQLASYAMGREVSTFETPRTARYGDKLHYAWYDARNKSLKYSFIDMTTYGLDTADNAYRYNVDGWTVIDGTSTGIDRVHAKVVNGKDTITTSTDIFSVGSDAIDKDGKDGDRDFSRLTATVNAATVNAANEKTQSCTVKLDSNNDLNKATDVSIAIMYTDAVGNFCYDLHDVTSKSVSNNVYTFSWDTTKSSETPTGMGRYTVAIYFGARNVVSSTSKSSSAGKYSSLDVTKTGKPVLVYYDGEHETLRVAYCTVDSNCNLASNWAICETGVSGGTYVQAKIDPKNNLHIMYRDSDGQLRYIKSKSNEAGEGPDGGAYTFEELPMVIETSGTYGTLSLMKDGTDYVPCVAFLNSEGTANGVKYSLLRDVDTGLRNKDTGDSTEKLWDTMVVPAVVSGGENHYITGGELVYVEGKSGSWDVEDDGVDTAECDAIVGFNTGRMDVVFLKSENIETTSQQ